MGLDPSPDLGPREPPSGDLVLGQHGEDRFLEFVLECGADLDPLAEDCRLLAQEVTPAIRGTGDLLHRLLLLGELLHAPGVLFTDQRAFLRSGGVSDVLRQLSSHLLDLLLHGLLATSLAAHRTAGYGTCVLQADADVAGLVGELDGVVLEYGLEHEKRTGIQLDRADRRFDVGGGQ